MEKIFWGLTEALCLAYEMEVLSNFPVPHCLFAVVALGASVALFPGCSRKSSRRTPPTHSRGVAAATSPSAQETAPTSTPPPSTKSGPIHSIGGLELRKEIAQSTARATIVNAWASWCGPCRREFPMLVALKDSLGHQGVDVIFVSVDDTETEHAALEFAEQHGVPSPIYVAQRPLGPFKDAMTPKWPGMLPATFLFDARGELRYFWPGPVYENELLPIIEGFLAGKNIDGVARVGLTHGKDYR